MFSGGETQGVRVHMGSLGMCVCGLQWLLGLCSAYKPQREGHTDDLKAWQTLSVAASCY